MSTVNLQRTFEGEDIYIGSDVHLKSWEVSVFSQEFELKTFTQPPDSKLLMVFLKRNYPGATYHCVYEAGFSGFTTQRALTSMGINCSVIHPADVPTMDKERKQKNDRIDSRKLGRGLKNGDLKAINVPDEPIEEDRALLTTYQHTKDFIKHQFGKEDVNFNELKYDFITEYEFYLKSVKGISHNTVMRYLKIFKKIVLLAVKNEWLAHIPQNSYVVATKLVFWIGNERFLPILLFFTLPFKKVDWKYGFVATTKALHA